MTATGGSCLRRISRVAVRPSMRMLFQTQPPESSARPNSGCPYASPEQECLGEGARPDDVCAQQTIGQRHGTERRNARMIDQVSEWPSAGNEVAALLTILTAGIRDSDMAGNVARGKGGSDRSHQNYQRRHPLAGHVELQIDPFRTGARFRAKSRRPKAVHSNRRHLADIKIAEAVLAPVGRLLVEREAGFETAPQPWRAALYQLSYSRACASLPTDRRSPGTGRPRCPNLPESRCHGGFIWVRRLSELSHSPLPGRER